MQPGDIHENARCPISARVCQASRQLGPGLSKGTDLQGGFGLGTPVDQRSEAPGEPRDYEV
jgi:hypothetical protein